VTPEQRLDLTALLATAVNHDQEHLAQMRRA
jgi:hypothetical protein